MNIPEDTGRKVRSNVAFAFGLWLIYHESEHGLDRPYLLTVGILLTGVQSARGFQRVVEAISKILSVVGEEQQPPQKQPLEKKKENSSGQAVKDQNEDSGDPHG